jgi:branched-chain amino acid transport system permease protein
MNHRDIKICTIAAILILVFPLVIRDDYYLHLLILIALFAQLASYWNLLDGYLGLIHFGYAAYIGIGAYTSALLAIHLGLPILLCMVLGGLLSGVIGVSLIIPCLRMVKFSTAIVTLAFGEIARIVASSWTTLTKGEMGLWGIPPLFPDQDKVLFFYLGFGFLFVGSILLKMLLHSRLGLAVVAIREDEIAAFTSGVEINRVKLLICGVSCFVAGIIGAFYAHYILTITPGLFSIGYTIQIMAMSMFGGKGTLLGPILGAFGLIFLGEGFRFIEDYRMLIYGLLIIGVVMVFPTGLVGGITQLKKWALRKR